MKKILKLLLYILVFAVLVYGLYILMISFKQPELRVVKCNGAYNCKIDEKNTGYYICNYNDGDNKVIEISCSSQVLGLSDSN